ncbi:uncharacterized protein EI90DRAFT_1399397 [Cantharellus anzutake]|uniref:uncharacterized protein n=1 Tax=Cantharellus anzutake TaxID=1750568 RepID=UPI0019043856|nr:uncharacterized protein EI90DRAFT_1399397 [Cantharellus anzutake]KAF8329463.1 hypothetical protein EI90DRAFT_1399397 [Cantharellus anzutake]
MEAVSQMGSSKFDQCPELARMTGKTLKHNNTDDEPVHAIPQVWRQYLVLYNTGSRIVCCFTRSRSTKKVATYVDARRGIRLRARCACGTSAIQADVTFSGQRRHPRRAEPTGSGLGSDIGSAKLQRKPRQNVGTHCIFGDQSESFFERQRIQAMIIRKTLHSTATNSFMHDTIWSPVFLRFNFDKQ